MVKITTTNNVTLHSRFMIASMEARWRELFVALKVSHFRGADKPERGHNSRKDLCWLSAGVDRRSAFAISIPTAVLVGLILLATTSLTVLAQSQNENQQPSATQPIRINPQLSTIFVVGDSTANNHANGALGWGDPFIAYFDSTKVNVLNRARAGRSSRTFITEGLWDKVLSELNRGDFVLIQFGHNDAGAINDAARARGSLPGIGEETEEIDNLLTKKHELVHTFGWYMRKMIADTRAKGATPIVLSLTVRNIWKEGHVERGPGKFGQWAAEVAKFEHVTFIDVTTLIADRYEELGEEKVKELFAADHTHTSPVGAELNASLVVAGLKMLKDKPLNRYLSAKGQ